MVLTPTRATRALFLGTGSIGRRHIRSLEHLRPDASLAFVREGAREDELSRATDALVLDSLASGLAWKPDIAIVATPSNLHYEALVELLSAGIPTFVEKPVVTSMDQLEALEALPTGSLPPTQVGLVLRFLGAVQTLSEWIASGRLGRIVRARIECGQYLPQWRPGTDYRASYSASSRRGGGVIFDLIHEVDLAVHLLGADTLAHAFAAKQSDLAITSEDVAHLQLSGPAGFPIAVGLDYLSRTRVRNVEIIGENANARLDLAGSLLELREGDAVVERTGEGFDYDAAFIMEIEELLNASETGGSTSTPLQEGLRSTRLGIQARILAGLPGAGVQR